MKEIRFAAQGTTILTQRQMDLIQCILDGCDGDEKTAQRMCISVARVKNMKQELFAKLEEHAMNKGATIYVESELKAIIELLNIGALDLTDVYESGHR